MDIMLTVLNQILIETDFLRRNVGN